MIRSFLNHAFVVVLVSGATLAPVLALGLLAELVQRATA
jgi:hypothetical protein